MAEAKQTPKLSAETAGMDKTRARLTEMQEKMGDDIPLATVKRTMILGFDEDFGEWVSTGAVEQSEKDAMQTELLGLFQSSEILKKIKLEKANSSKDKEAIVDFIDDAENLDRIDKAILDSTETDWKNVLSANHWRGIWNKFSTWWDGSKHGEMISSEKVGSFLGVQLDKIFNFKTTALTATATSGLNKDAMKAGLELTVWQKIKEIFQKVLPGEESEEKPNENDPAQTQHATSPDKEAVTAAVAATTNQPETDEPEAPVETVKAEIDYQKETKDLKSLFENNEPKIRFLPFFKTNIKQIVKENFDGDLDAFKKEINDTIKGDGYVIKIAKALKTYSNKSGNNKRLERAFKFSLSRGEFFIPKEKGAEIAKALLDKSDQYEIPNIKTLTPGKLHDFIKAVRTEEGLDQYEIEGK